MKIFLLTFFLLTLFNCASTNKELTSHSGDIIFDQVKSCTGRGLISSVGNFKRSNALLNFFPSLIFLDE